MNISDYPWAGPQDGHGFGFLLKTSLIQQVINFYAED